MKAPAAVLALLLVAACANTYTSGIDTPTPDYPCGKRSKACVNASSSRTGMCCWLGEECGGAPLAHCPDGMCCFVGPDSTGFESARPPHFQRRAQ